MIEVVVALILFYFILMIESAPLFCVRTNCAAAGVAVKRI